LQFTTIDISLWISAYTCHSHDHSSSLLLLQDASKYSPLFRKSFELPPCSSFRLKRLTVKSSHLSRIRSYQLLMCLAKILRSAIRSNKNPQQLIALKFLPACIMGNSRCLAVFIKIPYDCHSDHVGSTCVCMHALIRLSF
jgi:hypothetical protein